MAPHTQPYVEKYPYALMTSILAEIIYVSRDEVDRRSPTHGGLHERRWMVVSRDMVDGRSPTYGDYIEDVGR